MNLKTLTMRCHKCKQFFFSYDGSEICDICSYEKDMQDIVKEIKEQHKDEINDEQSN